MHFNLVEEFITMSQIVPGLCKCLCHSRYLHFKSPAFYNVTTKKLIIYKEWQLEVLKHFFRDLYTIKAVSEAINVL